MAGGALGLTAANDPAAPLDLNGRAAKGSRSVPARAFDGSPWVRAKPVTEPRKELRVDTRSRDARGFSGAEVDRTAQHPHVTLLTDPHGNDLAEGRTNLHRS